MNLGTNPMKETSGSLWGEFCLDDWDPIWHIVVLYSLLQRNAKLGRKHQIFNCKLSIILRKSENIVNYNWKALWPFAQLIV